MIFSKKGTIKVIRFSGDRILITFRRDFVMWSIYTLKRTIVLFCDVAYHCLGC